MEKSLFLISWAISSENCSSRDASLFTRENSDSSERARSTTSSRACQTMPVWWVISFFSRENLSADRWRDRIGRNIYPENAYPITPVRSMPAREIQRALCIVSSLIAISLVTSSAVVIVRSHLGSDTTI
jgi:hypothetical protein